MHINVMVISKIDWLVVFYGIFNIINFIDILWDIK